MKKNLIFKSIAVHTYILGIFIAVCVAESTLIPLAVCLSLVPFFRSMIKNMKEEDINKVFGVDFFQSKFENCPLFQDLDKE